MKKSSKKLATLGIALSLSVLNLITALAGEWKQDTTGWKIQNENGTYLVNSWYQSPTSGLFYYLGTDGYMLTNTTTPDGHTVDINGVWVQPSPQQQPKKSNNNTSGGLSQEEYDKRIADLGGQASVEVIDKVTIDENGGNYNWN